MPFPEFCFFLERGEVLKKSLKKIAKYTWNFKHSHWIRLASLCTVKEDYII